MLTGMGLFLTILGSTLLFFYGLPRKKVGNVILFAGTAMKVPPNPGERDVPDSEWQAKADSFFLRAKILNSTGFALVSLGTLLQLVGLGSTA